MKHFPNTVIWVFMVFSLSIIHGGCAPAIKAPTDDGPTKAYINEYEILPGRHVYLKLEKNESGSYVFTEVEINLDGDDLDPHYTEPFVNLNTLAPAFNTDDEKNCKIVGVEKFTDSFSNKCKTLDESLFRQTNTHILTTGAYALLSFGGSVAMGLKEVDVSFDEASYIKALKEALKESGLDKSRPKLTAAIDKYFKDADKIMSNYSSESSELIQRKSKPIRDDYNNYRGLGFEKNITIVDKTGLLSLWNGSRTVNDKLQEKIKIKHDKLRIIDAAPQIDINPEEIFPIKIRELNHKLVVGLSEIDDMKNALLNNIHKNLDRAGRSYEYFITCDNTHAAGFSILQNCPKSVSWGPGKKKIIINAEYIVDGYSIYSVYPKRFSMEDKNLRVAMKDGRIYFYNKTNQYLDIDSVSIYYNGNIKTYSDLKINIPPNAHTRYETLPSKLYEHLNFVSKFEDVTVEIAKMTKVNFGIATKYGTTNTNIRKTLYKVPNLSLYDAIVSRLK